MSSCGGARWLRWALSLGLVCLGCASGNDTPPDGGPGRRDLGPLADEDGDRVPSTIDCDDMDPLIGSSGERSCASDCAVGIERCIDGEWSECSAPTSCTCESTDPPRERDCAMCGTVFDTCVDDEWIAGSCMDQGSCPPGELQTRTNESAGCGECRVEQRSCGTDCEFPTEWECVEQVPDCNFWLLPNGATEWSAYHLASNPFAPTDPIRGAFPLEGSGEGWVFTDTRVHRFRTGCIPTESDPCWSGTDLLGANFADVAGRTLQFGVDIPDAFDGDGRQQVGLSSTTHDTRYFRDLGTETFELEFDLDAPSDPPADPEAAFRSQTTASFTVVGDVNGWASVACGDTDPAVPDAYIATIWDGQVSLFTVVPAGCASFEKVPFGSFPPFALPGAPAFEDVAAVFYASGLYVFAAD